MKTLWFRDTYIVFVLSSKFRPRVIPMLYSFYLIVYLICISYFIYSYYIYLYLILLFPFLYVCRLYIGFLLSLILCYFLFLCLFVLGIYDNIKDIDDFYFYVLFGVIGIYNILVIWGLLNYLYHRTGIYLFDFFFVCVFWDECKGFFYYP